VRSEEGYIAFLQEQVIPVLETTKIDTTWAEEQLNTMWDQLNKVVNESSTK
jgi:hypothetical protein